MNEWMNYSCSGFIDEIPTLRISQLLFYLPTVLSFYFISMFPLNYWQFIISSSFLIDSVIIVVVILSCFWLDPSTISRQGRGRGRGNYDDSGSFAANTGCRLSINSGEARQQTGVWRKVQIHHISRYHWPSGRGVSRACWQITFSDWSTCIVCVDLLIWGLIV